MKRKVKLVLLPLSVFAAFLFTSWDYSSSSLNGGGGDFTMLDKLFEIVQKENQEVKMWIEDWNKLSAETEIYKREYRTLIRDNEDYYKEANRLANAIKDEVLKTKAIALILASEENYKKKASVLKEKLTILDKQEQQMLELYAFLKIKYTLPKMEALQIGLVPDEQKFMNRNKAYEALIIRGNKMSQ